MLRAMFSAFTWGAVRVIIKCTTLLEGIGVDKRRDMTVGSEWKELLLFSLPIMAGQFLQQLYNTVDSIVVSHYGGATPEICDAMFAAVGSCTSLIFLFLAISLGLSNGGGGRRSCAGRPQPC